MNILQEDPLAQPTPVSAMIKPLNGYRWPSKPVLLPGLVF
ncbi:hypothetical protein JCM19239_3201 [Vibrio variabilis]|uniref:Uncharacterized protein n=1 Tax=Vibrio variabilis TaxID=990271 RepID=A0ABQ0JIF3_9VIBR|nr:hypothetical protein JCM19239_3201 [Vibrio variabilis]